MNQERIRLCAREQKRKAHQGTILIVDDEPLVRDMLVMVLEDSGFETLTASSAEEALNCWEVSGSSVDLLLTDLVMPGGTSGTQLAEGLRRQNPGLKVIFTSGYSAETAGREFQLGKEHYFLQKPFETPRLLALINQCLGRIPDR